MQPFLDAIGERVLVCDGAMGTMLYAKGVFLNRCFDELNLTQPDLVLELHQAYVRAGADLIETNTFGANRIKLAPFGLADKVHAINAQGVRIARHAAREQAYVAGSIGPLGIRIEPWGKTGVDEAQEYFREQAAALVEGGVDLFVLETFRDVREIVAAIAAVRSVSGAPIVAQMTTDEEGNTLDGTPPEAFAPELERLGVDVIGVNCSVGPAAMLETIERVSRVTRTRLAAQPNAGMPREIDGRNIYLCAPDYMASYARRFVLNGVKLVGGCCGTTPDHIRAIKGAVRAALATKSESPGRAASATLRIDAPAQDPVPKPEKSRLANLIARRGFVVLAELLPARGDQRDDLLHQAQTLKIHGVDAVTIPDASSPGGGRMSALSAAILIEQHAGIETVLHFSCRDRNLPRMQADLLGAHAIGLRNLLIVTGEPTRVGDYADATSVLDVDSIGFTNVVARFNRGLDLGGQPLGRPTAFHIGVAANPSAVDLDEEVRRFEYKVDAGAEFAILTPTFDIGTFERFLARIDRVRIPLIAGVRPLENLRQAEYLANEVPGMTVPAEYLARMRAASDPGGAAGEGLAIAREIVEAMRPHVDGVQIAVGSRTIDAVLALVDAAAPALARRSGDAI